MTCFFYACHLRIRAFFLVLTTKHPYNCNRYKAARRKIVCQHTRLTNHLKNSTPASQDSVAEWPPAKAARSSPLVEPMVARSSAPNFTCSMKREYRVRKHEDFDRIIQNGVALRSPHFSLFHERNDVNETHIGIAVGKKNGGAVARVKIKRQIRAIIASAWEDYSLPFDIIIIAKASYDTKDFSASKEELTSLLEKVKDSQH